jgi:uncharacterized protein (DUF342 family)
VIHVAKPLTEYELNNVIKQLTVDKQIKDTTNEQVNALSLTPDGWVQVKDQTIIIHDPADHGTRPVISALSPVRLAVNDVEVKSESKVSSKDRIRWWIAEQPLFEIKVSEDKLSAYFQLNSKERYAWQLTDIEPVPSIIITAEPNKAIVLQTIQLSDVITQLKKLSIRPHLDIASIQQEIDSPTYCPILVAKGKSAVSGMDARIQLYFSERVENRIIDITGTIDFRNHLNIPSVSTGEIIARKLRMVEAVPGYDVHGSVILPPPPSDVIIVARSGVELTPEGEVVALKEGRPRITGGKMKTFDITTSYIVNGDVNIESGHVVFSGDVIVYGNVTDHMIVESLGSVYVSGSVYNATITATGSIHIRGNVMGSKLYSGYFGVLFNRLYDTTKQLSERFEQLLSALRTLELTLGQRKVTCRYGQIVVTLIDHKFKDIPVQLEELLTLISSIKKMKKDQYQKLQEQSESLSNRSLLLAATANDLQGYHSHLRDTFLEVERMQEDKSKIEIKQCHNSELKSNGNIVIARNGVMLSDLYSAGSIVFKHDTAVCRGSKLEAGDSIIAKVIGSQMGANTILKAKKRVTVTKMFSGRICVGRTCTDVFELIENRTFNAAVSKQRA